MEKIMSFSGRETGAAARAPRSVKTFSLTLLALAIHAGAHLAWAAENDASPQQLVVDGSATDAAQSSQDYQVTTTRAGTKMLLTPRDVPQSVTVVTIIAQAPKMLPHVPQMRVNIAEDLGCHMDQVNVKATTTEKLGFTGRGEGIACEAVALLLKADAA